MREHGQSDEGQYELIDVDDESDGEGGEERDVEAHIARRARLYTGW